MFIFGQLASTPLCAQGSGAQVTPQSNSWLVGEKSGPAIALQEHMELIALLLSWLHHLPFGGAVVPTCT